MYNQHCRSFNYYFIKSLSLNILICSITLLISCTSSPIEKYGFIAKLGNDTVSVENVTREGNRVVSDEIDRFPRVRIRHAVINLNPDGSISRLVMDINTPSEPKEQRERKVIVDVTKGKVHISKEDKTGTVKREFVTNNGIVEAHVPQMYSLYELYFAAALKHAVASKLKMNIPIQIRQFYIDREFDHFPLGEGSVTKLGGNKVEITHDWLSGTGEAMIDSNLHMLSYTGARTTYKVEVKRVNSSPDIKRIAERFQASERKSGIVKELSVRDTTMAQIGNVKFMIDYGRPLMRGRTLLNDVLPYDRVWRTGANAATQFTTSALINLAGMQVPAGTYTLWTVPHKNSVDLIVNKQKGQWGTEYNSTYNLGMARISDQQVSSPVEKFTISISPIDKKHGSIIIQWGFFRWTAPIELL